MAMSIMIALRAWDEFRLPVRFGLTKGDLTKDELKEIACAGRRGIVTHAFGGIAGFARDCEHTTLW